MTSIQTAQPRPPHPLNLHPGLARAHSRSGSQLPRSLVKEEKDEIQEIDADQFHDRPAKRRKTSSASQAVSVGSIQSQSVSAQAHYQGVPWSTVVRIDTENKVDRGTDTALPPLPDRPWGVTASRENLLQDVRPPVRVRKNIAVPNTPDCIEIPSDAPLWEHNKRADYFPWTGKHPEDVLNESSVRQGFYDRPPNPADKELNTAKPQLYNAFKHRSGLESLSALFSIVLDAKSRRGAYSSTSSFKGPPPRVTLTEAKRKSWISDLADPDVPLRKLSKTIPQGIRGPSLLDQCLQNNIPLGRAIWFTKCVGANEIRTLKRKGVNPAVSQGAEVKWLREWTANVEQFIEGNLAQCGQNKWREKTRYSLLLAARLYLENLLDRDHYLDWILKSFSTSNPNHWPFWLMIIHLHRLDLVAFRKKGKQLAENLILKYNTAQTAPGEALQPLAKNFAAVIQSLILARPNCFLMPDRWAECQKALTSCHDSLNEIDQQTLDYLKFANERASGSTRQGGTAAASPLEQVVDLLDSFRVGASVPVLYDALCTACPDRELLMRKSLEWCVSKYRTGKTRIYLSARLFRKLRKQNYDVDRVLLDFLFDRSLAPAVDSAALRHFISELSRSQTFPISKYMQWLSVRGLPLPGSVSRIDFEINVEGTSTTLAIQECDNSQQMLTELCMSHTEDHLNNLRNSLLARAGFDEEAEASAFELLRSLISNAVGEGDYARSRERWSHVDFGRLPWTIRTRLSYWLRTEAATFAKASQTETPGKPPLPGARSWTLGRFHIVRNVLEKCRDIAILADILRITASSRQEDVLAAAVDTINMHCSSLTAIGALEPLQLLYGQTYIVLRTMKPAMPLYATALINLCQHHPNKTTPIQALQQDFIRGDRGRAVTACSPFSDGVAESLQQAGATFHDDFEAILQTESNMNDQTMLRLFKVLIERIEKTQHSENGASDLLILCQLLARLKLCQKSQGELLLKKWIARVCSNQHQLMSPRLLYSLINTRCTQLEVILEACQQLPAGSVSRLRVHSSVRRAILDDPEDGVDETMFYAFKLGASKLVHTRPAELLEIIGTDESGKSSGTAAKSMAIAAIISNPELMKMLSKPAWLVVSQTLSEHLTGISPSDPPELQAKSLAILAGPLSLPYCALRMRMLCQNSATKNDEAIQDAIASMLCATVGDSASLLSTSPRTFQTFLRATGPVVSSKVRSHVEQAFFNSLPKFLQSKSFVQPAPPTPEDIRLASAALQQVVLVSTETASPLQSGSVGGLIEKLTIYMKMLGPSSNPTPAHTVSSPTSASMASMLPATEFHAFLVASLDCLDFLLQMLCIKRNIFSAPPSQASSVASKSLQQDQVKLVGLLISIGTHPTWSSMLMLLTDRVQQIKVQASIDFAFDVAATLVDDMSDESRNFCARILKDKLKDERVRWLLGSINSFGSTQSHEAGHGYQVVHETKGVLGEWKPKIWEMLESTGGDSCLGLGLFGARKA